MRPVLVDSNVLLASRDLDSGEQHERATEIVRGIDHGELPTAHVVDYVVAETLNLLHARDYHEVGAAFYDGLSESAGFEIRRTTKADFGAGVETYRDHDELSFVDGVLAAYVRRTDIEYIYTFDREFVGLDGVTPLSTAVDPYA